MILLKAEHFPFFLSPQRAGVFKMPSNEDVYIYNNYTAPRLRFLTWIKENSNIEYLGDINNLSVNFLFKMDSDLHNSKPSKGRSHKMKLFHIVLNVTNADWTKKGELKHFFEISQSKADVKEKFILFKDSVVISIIEYKLFLEPLTVQFSMSAYNIHGQVIFCESQPTEVKNTLDLIEKLENYRKQEYLTVDWKII